jgi:hypothetical protein
MSIPAHFKQIIDVLQKATNPPWQETAANDTFAISVDRFTVQIRESNIDSGSAYFGRELTCLDVGVFDAKGQLIDNFVIDSRDEDYKRLREIYERARRLAKKVDEKFEELTRQLKNKLGT